MSYRRLLGSILAFLFVFQCAEVYAEIEQVTYVHSDHLGSPILGRDANGQTVFEYDYRPYGTRDVSQGEAGFVGYTGHAQSDELGLVYARARWVDPSSGRFLSSDPVRFLEGGSEHFNRYVYANNSPYAYVDPTGERGKSVAWLLKRSSTQLKQVARLTKEQAVRARKKGQDIQADRKAVAKQVERAAHGDKKLLRHEAHKLKDGSIGRPHFQTDGSSGHSFWGLASGFAIGLADVLDGAAEAASYFDPSVFGSGSAPAPDGWQINGWGMYEKVDPNAPEYHEAMRLQYEKSQQSQ